MVKDEQGRALLTSMVACLFARSVYTDELLASCLNAVGYGALAGSLGAAGRNIQQLRWKMRLATGYKPEEITIPKRFHEVTTAKGPVDTAFLIGLTTEYAKTIRELGQKDEWPSAGN
jgi:aldehyde:ferredoxin oxidoreductase